MSKKFIITIATFLIVALLAGLAIFLAKGYTFSPTQKRIVGTGIITVSSVPDAASVYLDGHLTTATNATISSLSPKTYTVKVVKEGFIPWEKSIEVKEGIVTELKVTLFPAIPTIYPLTFTGVSNPVLSPDGEKLVFFVPGGKKAGVWVWSMGQNQPISFVRNSEPHQISTNSEIDFSKASFKWSPDSKQILATVDGSSFLLDSDKMNTSPRDVTLTLSATLKSWQDDSTAKDEARIEAIRNLKIRKIASDSAVVKWAPDETKFMARREPLASAPPSDQDRIKAALISDMKVYDLEDKKEYSLPPAREHLWLPDSRHVILVEDGTISLVDYDGTNRAVIYAGSFLDGFVFPWPDYSRLVIISSLPTPTASEPNFYGINLK